MCVLPITKNISLMERLSENESTFIPQAKILRVFELIIGLTTRRYTIGEIAEKLAVSERSAYRYLTLLNGLKVCIDKDFYNRYFIAQDDCPFCHRLHNADREYEFCHSDTPASLGRSSPTRRPLKEVFSKLNLHSLWQEPAQ